MKRLIIASLTALLLSSCGAFKKKEEVGPYGDHRSGWEKLGSWEAERYDNWVQKSMDPVGYQRKKRLHGNKPNP